MASYSFRKGSGIRDSNSTSTRKVGACDSSNSQRPARKCFVAVTQDGETYSTVDLTGSIDAQAIRSRILSKACPLLCVCIYGTYLMGSPYIQLDIPGHLSSDYGIFRTEIGDLATGSALDDDELLGDFHYLINNKSSRHLFVQHLRDLTHSDPTTQTGTEIGFDTEEPDSEVENEQCLGKEAGPGTNCDSKLHTNKTDGRISGYQILGGTQDDGHHQQVDAHLDTDNDSRRGHVFENELQDTATPTDTLRGEFEIIALAGANRRYLQINQPPFNLINAHRESFAQSFVPSEKPANTWSLVPKQQSPHPHWISRLSSGPSIWVYKLTHQDEITELPVAGTASADIYRGVLSNGRAVALKCYRSRSDGTLWSAVREQYIWSMSRHPFVLNFLGVAQYRNQIALVSPWMENGNLRQFLSGQRHNVDRYLLGFQIAEAISWLHNTKIVHGNIMGDSILIAEDYTPKITNFGCSRLMDQGRVLEFPPTNHFEEREMGIRWKAPELIEGQTGDTVEADIYALGMTILETLTGTLPYSEVPQDMIVLRNIIGGVYPARPEVHLPVTNIQADALWSLLLHCWALDPIARPAAFDVRRQMRDITLARLPTSRQDQLKRELLSDNQLLVLKKSSHKSIGIPRVNAPDFQYVPSQHIATAPLSQPSGSHSDTNYHGLQNNEGISVEFIENKQSFTNTQAATIHSEMTIEEILGHLTEHGCNDITRELRIRDCQCQYPISTGGYGDIYRGTLSDGRVVGLKCIRLLFDSSEKGRKKLKYTARELYVWSRCNHPNVMGLIGLAQFRNQLAMVSAWMENGNMCEFLRRHPQTDRHLLCAQIINGVIYLHERGIVHGDLKGANILISRDRVPKITDFGNSILKECSLRFSGTSSGPAISIRWTAPEILEDKGGITTEADVYALGMTILEAITGEVPYDGIREVALPLKIIKSVYPKRPELHMPSQNKRGNHLWSLLLDCWAYEPHLRPTATIVQDRMRHVVEGD